MVSRAKDVKALNKHLLKRYSSAKTLTSSDRKLLDILVYALFLENGDFERALESFDLLERYFIDWNEIRVAKAEEISEVIGEYKGAVRDGERLRRLLQSIFDLTFRFDLEEFRTKGVESLVQFLDAIPYSTPFMLDFVRFFVFGENVLPCSEGMLRVLRALNLVEVQGEREVAVLPQKRYPYKDLSELFVVLFQFGVDLMNPETRPDALKFLESFDKAATSRSAEPLVASKWPSDPREIARLLSHKEKTRKSPSTLKDDVKAEASSDDEDERESYDEQDESTMEVGETILTMTSESVSSTTVPEEAAPKPKRRVRVKDELPEDGAKKATSIHESKGDNEAKLSQRAKSKVEKRSAEKSVMDVREVGSEPADVANESQEVAKPSATAPKQSRSKKLESTPSHTELPDAKSSPGQSEESEPDKLKKRAVKKAKNVEVAEGAVASKSVSVKKSAAKKSKSSVVTKKVDADVTSAATSVESESAPASGKVAQTGKKKTKPVDDGAASKPKTVAAVEEPGKEVKASKRSARGPKKASVVEEAESTVKGKKKTVKHNVAKVKDSQAEPPDNVPAEAKKKRVRKVASVADSAASTKEQTPVVKESAAPKKKRVKSKSGQDDELKIQEIQQKKPR
ncbi:MAG: hypothetical protein IJU03_05100 [Thermoguttaceae bacterium]|nr:hypothetical protein [Thermoguttaceae bacterium]